MNKQGRIWKFTKRIIKNNKSHPAYKCPNCGRTNIISKRMAEHIRTCSNLKSYKCTDCNRRFNIRCNWKKHLLIHLREKKFQCPICLKKFRRKDQKKRHLRLVHKITNNNR